MILPSTSAGIRYVTVIASSLDVPDTQFTPASNVSVKVGDAKHVINLITGETARAEKRRRSARSGFRAGGVSRLARSNARLRHSPSFADDQSGPDSENVGGRRLGRNARGPVRYTLTDSAGKARATFDRLSGTNDNVSYNIPSLEPAGDWTVSATDSLTGLIAKATVKVSAADTVTAVAMAPDVYLPHSDRLPPFLNQPGPVRVVVEETQTALQPDAERIVAALKKIGRDASIQSVTASSYDMYWLRWIPTSADEQTLAKIDAGEVVGYRGELRPYINTAKRTMVPEKGGWTDIVPPYVLRTDVILFSGGRIADSLDVLSDWTGSTHFPGRGRGVVEVEPDPFWANRDAISVVSHDEAGRKATVDRLIELVESRGKTESAPISQLGEAITSSSVVTSSERVRLETPLKGFVPPTITQSISASSDGWAAVQTKDATVVISPGGEFRRCRTLISRHKSRTVARFLAAASRFSPAIPAGIFRCRGKSRCRVLPCRHPFNRSIFLRLMPRAISSTDGTKELSYRRTEKSALPGATEADIS